MKKRKNGKSKNRKPVARKANPGFPFFKKTKANRGQRRRRRNPEILKQPVEMLKLGALALGGFVAARQVPQLVLKDKNTSWIGYLSNGAVAGLSALAAWKLIGKEAGKVVLIGGGMYVVNRLLVEKLSPIGNMLSLSGVGDAAAAGRLGVIRNGYYPVPVKYDAQGNPVFPQALLDAAAKQAAMAAKPQTAAPQQLSGVRLAGANRLQPRL